MTRTLSPDRRFASTLARGLSILRTFRASDDGLGNGEISRRVGIPKSSVSRLTFTLESLGYLTHDSRNARYRLGPAVLALGNIASASLPFMQVANPVMRALADETGTLVLLGVRDCEKLLLVKTWRPQGTASIWLDVGYRLPLPGTSSGQALLGAMTDAEFAAVEEECGGALDCSAGQLRHIRRETYSQMVGHGFVIAPPKDRFASTINAVSVPYRSHEISEPVVFSCGAMPEILPDERMTGEVGPMLHRAVRDLEHATGQPSAMRVRG